MIKIKPGVSIAVLTPQMLMGHMIAASVLADLPVPYDYIITGGCEGKHGRASLHFTGNAGDHRSRHIPESQRKEISDLVAEALGDEFDAVLEQNPEQNHFHIEFQPKKGVNQ